MSELAVFIEGTAVAIGTGNSNLTWKAPKAGYIHLDKSWCTVATQLAFTTSNPIVGLYVGGTKRATLGGVHTTTPAEVTGIATGDVVGKSYGFAGDPQTLAEEKAYPRPTGERGFDQGGFIKVAACDEIKINTDTAATGGTVAGALRPYIVYEPA